MENLKWGFRARVVAYIHLILFVPAWVIGIMIMIFVPGIITLSFRSRMTNPASLGSGLFIGTWMLCVFFVGFYLLLDFVAAIKLFNSTKLGAEPSVAINGTRSWCIIRLVLFTVVLLILLCTLSFLCLAIHIIIRVPMFYIVWNYTKDLEEVAMVSPSTPTFTPTNLIPFSVV